MEKEFIPYEQALALKELEFNRRTFAEYSTILNNKWVLTFDLSEEGQYPEGSSACIAPTFSQAFRWFRENHNLYAEVKVEDSVKLGGQKFYWIVFGACKSFEGSLWIRCLEDSNGVMSNTYEEAELECLKKLIEIVKQK